MRYSKKVFILGLLICLCLTACGKEASQNTSTPSGTANSGVENYTKYADYELVESKICPAARDAWKRRYYGGIYHCGIIVFLPQRLHTVQEQQKTLILVRKEMPR